MCTVGREVEGLYYVIQHQPIEYIITWPM